MLIDTVSVLVGAFGIALVAMAGTAFFTVDQRTAAIVQRFGRFLREAGPGLHVKVPFIDKVIGRINLRVQQLDVTIEASSRTNAILIPHSPGNLASLSEQMRNAMIEADQVRVPEPVPGASAELRRAFDDEHLAPVAARRELSVETVGV